MPKRIHFEDDLYFLAASIKMLQNAMTLEVDSDYFADRIVEDVFFIDATLETLYSSLSANAHLIGRQDYLRSTLSVKRSFADFLTKVNSAELRFAEFLQPFFGKFNEIKERQLKDINAIYGSLAVTGVGDGGEADIVSGDELTELLRDTGGDSANG
jgi:hypothetical protein